MSTGYGMKIPFDQHVKNCHGLGEMPRAHRESLGTEIV